MKYLYLLIGKIKKLFIYEPPPIFKDINGDLFVVAEPERFREEEDPFTVRIIEKVEKDKYGVFKRCRLFVSWYGDTPDYLTEIK